LPPNEGVALGCAGGMVRPPSPGGMPAISIPRTGLQGNIKANNQGR
jgi:hypothetical protein